MSGSSRRTAVIIVAAMKNLSTSSADEDLEILLRSLAGIKTPPARPG